MKFSENWLREWVDTDVPTQELVQQLTMSGLELESLVPVCDAQLDKVVVGCIVEMSRLTDRLNLCQVDIESEILQIVCGAKNLKLNDKVPVAIVGAELPGGIAIEPVKLQGADSFGMLCSEKELGLAEESSGVLVLPVESSLGQSVFKLLKLDDHSIELGLTPNRSDCLSVLGVAREVSVLNRCNLIEPETYNIDTSDVVIPSIEISEPMACPVYCGRVITNINLDVETPLWMREKLRRSGLRSISPIVDIGNFVMLELGQPMHAFDLDKIQGKVNVRFAQDQEQMTLLDGQSIKLASDALVIADDHQAIALAGIMGGKDTAIDFNTKSIFLESAFFSPTFVAGQARKYGLRTDSSHRFERGVDPALAEQAINRATQLILDIVGGTAGVVEINQADQHITKNKAVTFRLDQIKRILGIDLPEKEVETILLSLGMMIERLSDREWSINPPSYRFDIEIEADLIEEIARVYGYNNIADEPPQGSLTIDPVLESVIPHEQISYYLLGLGYQEIISFSFIDEKSDGLFKGEKKSIGLLNPISNDLAVMRTSLWPGLLKNYAYNQSRQQKNIRLYEIGNQYHKSGEVIVEKKMVAGLVSGSIYPQQWGIDERLADFYDIKSDVEKLLKRTRVFEGIEFMPVANSDTLHPGQSARIQNKSGDLLGMVGKVHPLVAKTLDISPEVLLFELDYDLIVSGQLPQFEPFSRFPSTNRDLALLVDDNIPADEISEAIKSVAGELLLGLNIFDIYQGKGVDSGSKSVAISLTLQDFSRTLTDGEVDMLMSKILDHVKQRFGATLRE